VPFHAPTPVLRIFDEAKARQFYLGFLGFQVDFEHRFEPNAPLYMGISRDSCKLHLSEHHGDACPGSATMIMLQGIDDYHREVTAKDYRYYKPGIEDEPWGARVMKVTDPFANRLLFAEPTATK